MRRPVLTLLCASLLVACGDDGRDPTLVPPSSRQDAGDLDAGLDADLPDFVDPCEGVTCSGQGDCTVGPDEVAICVCGAGFAPVDGPDCAPGNAPPIFSNLPAGVSVLPIRDGSFQAEASDPEGGAVTFARDSSACSFDVAVSPVGLVTFTCPAIPEVCDVVVAASDDAPEPATARAALSIGCSNQPPRFRSAPPPSRLEGEDADYGVSCVDPEGEDVTVTVAPEDTCGGSITIVGRTPTYTRLFTEADGGTFCTLAITCSDGVDSASQDIALEIVELNDDPTFANLPGATQVKWGTSGAFTAQAADADLPAQSITYALESHDCASATPAVDGSGEVSITCGAPETCEVVVGATDDFIPPASVTAPLTVECTNTLPTVSDVTVTPAVPEPGDLLTCTYTYADADGDPDASTFQWYVNGNPVPLATTSQLGTGFGAADEIVCEVTPADGSGQTGAPVQARANAFGARPLLDLGSAPGGRVLFDGALHFGAADLSNARHVWRTDGTAAGTRSAAQVKGVPMGVVGPDLLLSAQVDAAVGRELYKLDAQGAVSLVADISAAASSNPSAEAVVDGVLYFKAFGDAGLELYASDGTTAGTQLLVDGWAGPNPGAGSAPARVGNTTVFHSVIGFGADAGSNLYATGGTAASTSLVSTIGPAPGAGVVGTFAPLGATLYFTASSAASGAELWSTDGATAQLALEHVPGVADGLARSAPVVFGASVYFVAADGDLYRYDPATMSAAARVFDLNTSGSDEISELVVTPLGLYFYANDGTTGAEVHHLDAAGSVTRLADAVPGTSNLTGRILPLSEGGVAFQVVEPSGAESLWISVDGTPANTFEAFSDGAQDDVTLLYAGSRAFYFFTRFGPNYKLYVYYY
jgi:ELWxxDGT repeat protein